MMKFFDKLKRLPKGSRFWVMQFLFGFSRRGR